MRKDINKSVDVDFVPKVLRLAKHHKNSARRLMRNSRVIGLCRVVLSIGMIPPLYLGSSQIGMAIFPILFLCLSLVDALLQLVPRAIAHESSYWRLMKVAQLIKDRPGMDAQKINRIIIREKAVHPHLWNSNGGQA